MLDFVAHGQLLDKTLLAASCDWLPTGNRIAVGGNQIKTTIIATTIR